jgi:DNA-binding response OmpR family regulator
VVLDVNLPGCDGFEILRRIRAADVPSRVLMLTARADVMDRVQGLRSGADDYVTKPFSMDELLARVEVLGRRGGANIPEDMVHIGGIVMEVGKRRVTLEGEVIALSPREFDVLRIFMQEPGRVFSRDEICERIWNREHEYDTRTVEIFIMRLRKKLCAGGEEPLIETVRGVGYKMRRL